MNTRKIMGVVGALVCAINFFAAAPAGAAVPSVKNQEEYAHKLDMKHFGGVFSTSDEARRIAPILNEIEKRICSANGLTITTQRFQDDYDFETKLHPVQMVDANNAYAPGAGYIQVGVQNIIECKAQNFKNQYDYICMEKLLSHEITHNIEGHTLHRQSSDNAELKAEKGSVRLTDALPEGGWGVYLVALNRESNRPEQNEQVMASFEKEAKQRIKIERPDKVYYRGSEGKDYLIMSEGYYLNTPCEDNAYFGGQVAYCIAKGAFRPENIQIAPNNLQDIKFEGDYLLVCRSPKLPNGYRVLTGLYGDREMLGRCLSGAKRQVQDDIPLPAGYSAMSKAISKLRDEHPIEKSYYQIWMACAIAQDNANR